MTPVPGRPTPPLIAGMFGRIAARYDLMNQIMTAGLDAGWRRAAVRAAQPPPAGLSLDVGTGTARLAAALARVGPGGRVVGVDLTLPMLCIAQRWLWLRDEGTNVSLAAGDALALPFSSGRFDCVTSAFTVRNVPDLLGAFREQCRVAKPGGRIVCLELAWPNRGPLRALFPLYFGVIVPWLGQVVAGDRGAYSYLPASVRAFPSPSDLAGIMRRAGLVDVRWRRLGFGAVTLHLGRRPGSTVAQDSSSEADPLVRAST